MQTRPKNCADKTAAAVLAVCILLLAGCAGLPKLSQAETATARTRNKVTGQQRRAVARGLRALIDFRRASLHAATTIPLPADCAAARNRLDGALGQLRTVDGVSAPRGMEAILQALANAMAAMDIIIAASKGAKTTAVEQGWHCFDAAAFSLADELRPRSFIGLKLIPVTPAITAKYPLAAGGLLVDNVLRNEPAFKAGIRMGDVVIAYDNRKTLDPAEFMEEVLYTQSGTKVHLDVVRKGKPMVFNVVVRQLNRGF